MSKHLWNAKVTIYNDISKTQAEERHFDRFVIPDCQVQGGWVENADGTIRNVINAQTIITKAVDKYKPYSQYISLPVDKRKAFFTVKTGDFVVFDVVNDVVTNASEFADLQQKYKDNGIKIKSFNAYINGMAVDNVSMSNI